MINYDHISGEIHEGVTVTQFRRHAAHYIAMVRYGGDWVCIQRRGCDPVFLVSNADMDLINERLRELDGGPRDAKGQRSGLGFGYWLRQLLKAERSGDPARVADVKDSIAYARFSAKEPERRW